MDPIKQLTVALYQVPLKNAVSDAKVLTGRQKPLSHIGMLTVTIEGRTRSCGTFAIAYEELRKSALERY